MEERQTCDLAGIWRFEIDKEDRGFAEHWEKRRLTQTITLPGCLQAQAKAMRSVKIHRGFKVCMMRCCISAANMRMRRRMEQKCHF